MIQRAGIVAGLVVDDADQMERPCEREADLVGFRELDRFGREGECVLGAPSLMGDGCELIERFGFGLPEVVGTRQHACVERELPSPVGVVRPTRRRLVQQQTDLLLFDRQFRRCGLPHQLSSLTWPDPWPGN